MKRLARSGIVVVCLLALVALGGCVAQQDMVLTGGDVVKAVSAELRQGVLLYDASVKANIGKIKDQLRAAAVREFTGAPVTQPAGKDTPEQKAASLLKVIDDILIEEQRRNELKAVMLDNLDFLDKTATDMQKATIYSASIDAQVKDWMRSQLNVKKAVATSLTPATPETLTK